MNEESTYLLRIDSKGMLIENIPQGHHFDFQKIMFIGNGVFNHFSGWRPVQSALNNYLKSEVISSPKKDRERMASILAHHATAEKYHLRRIWLIEKCFITQIMQDIKLHYATHCHSKSTKAQKQLLKGQIKKFKRIFQLIINEKTSSSTADLQQSITNLSSAITSIRFKADDAQKLKGGIKNLADAVIKLNKLFYFRKALASEFSTMRDELQIDHKFIKDLTQDPAHTRTLYVTTNWDDALDAFLPNLLHIHGKITDPENLILPMQMAVDWNKYDIYEKKLKIDLQIDLAHQFLLRHLQNTQLKEVCIARIALNDYDIELTMLLMQAFQRFMTNKTLIRIINNGSEEEEKICQKLRVLFLAHSFDLGLSPSAIEAYLNEYVICNERI
ncbi:MAG: hypothetical protein NTV32_08760 [Gammaproteobacteria bacterium]|nr:hypothetical protein [Gammaproteobacteria bacterium]